MVLKELEMRSTPRDVRRNKQHPGSGEKPQQAGSDVVEI